MNKLELIEKLYIYTNEYPIYLWACVVRLGPTGPLLHVRILGSDMFRAHIVNEYAEPVLTIHGTAWAVARELARRGLIDN